MTNCNGTSTNCCNGTSTNCCNGTSTNCCNTPSCYSSSSTTISKTNCGCTPCDTPVIVNQGDVSNQVLVPVLADVIQNCMSVSRYETAYPSNLLVTTDLPIVGTGAIPPSGPICISGVSYSYSCLGVSSVAVSAATAATLASLATPPVTIPSVVTISAFADSTPINLSSTALSCTCSAVSVASGASVATGTATGTALANEFTGSLRTNNCCCQSGYCCDPIAQPYAQTKFVETGLSFAFCNLAISVNGTIGCQPFTGTVSFASGTTVPVTTIPFATSGVPISAFGFPPTINFAGRLCLPTNTRVNIQESFDNCFIVDCVRPVTATYSPATNAVTGGTFASFLVTADLSLVLNKNVYAITPEKLAVITNCGAQVICNDGNTTPSCPQSSCGGGTSCCPQSNCGCASTCSTQSSCVRATPCPGPRGTVPTV